ncbi:PadR family transcriptional regulator [Microbacteriaceae bacterium 4G12]
MENRALILLGILMAQSQHGYQIHEFIERNLSNITDMKKATAYATLDKLSKEGYVDVHTEQEGNRPPRKVYTINDKGRSYFLTLLRGNLSLAGSMYYPGDIGVMFLDHLPTEEVVECLKGRLHQLEGMIEWHKKAPRHGKGKGVDLAIEHQLVMITAEHDWLTIVIERLKEDI